MARRRLLLVADHVRTLNPAQPAARAVLVDGDWITWVGDNPDDAPARDGSSARVDLDGALLQPGFVDAHVHLTATGLSLGGLDLRDARSVADCLAAVRAIADVTPGRVIWGAGWDEFAYPEARPPNADELAEASGGLPVLLTRTDGHSSVIDRVSLETCPLARVDGVERDAAGRPTGLLRREANHVARRWFLAALPASQLAEARELVARHALELGITSVHEMGGPDVMGAGDFEAWCAGTSPIEVVCYWGAADLDFVRERGLRQIGGDLLLDGSLGSRTAALVDEYRDMPGTGSLYESTADLAAFVTDATRRRVQVAFHCIGDAAVRQAVEVITMAAANVGLPAVRAARHRLEHCELVPPTLIARMAELGVVASLQPTFDRLWGHAGGLYERRLGHERAELMNPLRPLADAGVTLAFGSDTNVSPMGPWAIIEAATSHHRPDYRLDEDRALRASIIGGRRAARQRGVGILAPGQQADVAAFELVDGRPGRCVLTMVRGRIVHDRARSRS